MSAITEATTGARCAQRAEARTSEGRACLYGFLARLFCSQPTEQSRRTVMEMTRLLDIDCSRDWALSELERDYMDLFVVPNPRYVAPYESAFLDSWLLPPALAGGPGPGEQPRTMKRLLMGESTLAVRQCFLEAGVEPREDLPDHISNELRLMAHLWYGEGREPAGGQERLREQRARLRDEHLLKWVGELRRKVAEHDRSGFYTAALRVVEVVLENDSS